MSSLTFYGGVGDCWDDEISFHTGNSTMWIGGNNYNGFHVTNWIPILNVNLPKGLVIDSATLYWTAADSRGDAPVIQIYMEDADNPTTPASGADIVSRVKTTAYTSVNPVETYNTGTEYSYDITEQFQEVLNRSGFVYGNNMAVIVTNSPRYDYRRTIATYENTTYPQPYIVVEFTDFVPNMLIF